MLKLASEIQLDRADDLILAKYAGESDEESEAAPSDKPATSVPSPATTKKTPSPISKKKAMSIFVRIFSSIQNSFKVPKRCVPS